MSIFQKKKKKLGEQGLHLFLLHLPQKFQRANNFCITCFGGEHPVVFLVTLITRNRV